MGGASPMIFVDTIHVMAMAEKRDKNCRNSGKTSEYSWSETNMLIGENGLY